MRTPLAALAGCWFLSLFCGGATFAQDAQLSGRVTDQHGLAVAKAKIEAVNVVTNLAKSAETNESGFYVISGLAPALYRVVVEKEGFDQVVRPNVELHVDDYADIDFQLHVGSLSTEVVVEGGAPLINTEDATVSTVIDRQLVENLPLNGRSFQSLIQMTPGVVLSATNVQTQGQFSVNGQRAGSNYFTLDGVSANLGGAAGANLYGFAGGSVPGLSAQGGTNNLVSVDAMQEFRIQTSTYAPEFGRTPGAQISILTRSGTNAFHGVLFDYFGNDVLDANNWFNTSVVPALPKAKERQNDFGGVLGGPIIKNKTFFFFSYEGLRLRIPTTLISTVPSLSARADAIPESVAAIDAFPLPTGPEILSNGVATGMAPFDASFSNPSSLDAYSIRVDHTVNSRLQLFGRYSYAPSSADLRANSGTAGSVVQNTHFGTRSITLGTTINITNSLINDFRYNYSTQHVSSTDVVDTFGGATPPPDSALFSTSAPLPSSQALYWVTLSNGLQMTWINGLIVRNIQRQTNIVDSVSFLAGSHSLKFGIDYRHLSPSFIPRDYLAELGFTNANDLAAGSLRFLFSQSSRRGDFSFNNFGAFAQDTWKPKAGLTITYGIRWDLDFSPTTSDSGLNLIALTDFQRADLSTFTLANPGAPLWHTTYGNFAPRIGLAYKLHSANGWETVLRSGAGIFYDLASQQAGQIAQAGRVPFGGSTFISGVSRGGPATFPLTPAEAVIPPTNRPLPIGGAVVFNPNFKLPYTVEWNVALEQSLGTNQTISATYLGASGRRLSLEESGSNASFPSFLLLDNLASSNYNALQLQFQRKLSAGLQALAGYTLSHAIDNASSEGDFNTSLIFAGTDPNINRGPSDFDIRHYFTLGVTYDVPMSSHNKLARAILANWSTNGILITRTASPVTIVDDNLNFSVSNALVRPDLVPGVPLYLFGSQFPGGKAFNPAAFQDPPTDADGDPLRQGTMERNSLRGFGLTQLDFALRRQFNISERLHLQFRGEMFNIFNHPAFGQPDNQLSSSSFGLSTATLNQSLGTGGISGGFSPLYQLGGPRAIRLALKLLF